MEEKPTNDIDLIDVDEFEEAEANSNTEPDPKKPDGTEKTPEELEKEKEELKAKNAKFAEMRRQKEAEEKALKEKAELEAKEAKIRKEAAEQAELGLLKTNPYTQEPITDAEDLSVYKIQRALEEEGKDPVKDLPKRLAELNRKRNKDEADKEQARVAADKELSDRAAKENLELREKYPDVNTMELAADPLFKQCMHGRIGRWSLVEVYELYLDKKKKADEEAEQKRINESSNTTSKTPSAGANGSPVSKKTSDMTDEEFKDYWKQKYGE